MAGLIIRLLLFIAIAALVYLIVKAIMARLRGKGSQPLDNQPAPPIVRCARCGVHVPQSEALYRDGQAYCSKAHRDDPPT